MNEILARGTASMAVLAFVTSWACNRTCQLQQSSSACPGALARQPKPRLKAAVPFRAIAAVHLMSVFWGKNNVRMAGLCTAVPGQPQG